MLGDWPLQFRMFLTALGGERCPFCAVVEKIDSEETARLARRPGTKRVLCGAHLASLMAILSNETARVGISRSTLGASINQKGRLECVVCKSSGQVVERLCRPIRWLDSRVRFQKTLEGAPLFCHAHVQRVGEERATRFVQIQQRKVQKLINDLAQAQLRNRPEIQSLIERAVQYLSSVPSVREPTCENPSIETTQDQPESAIREFVNWDRERQLEYLGKLESEAASLRYRNAVLAEENRALRLARIADESIRRDLERDREELLARDAARTIKLQP